MLLPIIDHGDIQADAGEKSGLADPKNETTGKETVVVLDESSSNGDDCPGKGHGRDCAMRLEPPKGEHEWHHEDNVSDEEQAHNVA